MLERVLRWFETRIDPLAPLPDRPVPRSALGYLWFFVSQARLAFAVMLVLGGVTALVEAALYVYIGDLIDLMQQEERTNFVRDHLTVLLAMAATVLLLRPLVATLTSLIEEQIIVPGFFNLVRFQGHTQVSGKSLAYFQDEFAGRISQKVWQSGQAAGDFMVSLLQIVWFIVVFALFTVSLAAALNAIIGLAVVVWLVVFAAAAAYFVPRIRMFAKESAHAASGVTGRLVDSYGNIQTLKLFASGDHEDAGTRAAYGGFLKAILRFTRTLTGMRVTFNALSGVMITAIAALCVSTWQSGGMTTGDVALVLALVLRLHNLLGRLMGQLNGLFRALGTLQDSAETITRPVTVADRIGAASLSVSEGGVRFERVTFHYGKEGGVIEDLSLDIRPGERVGLVGRSGAGKSTLVNLLLRFYDIEGGRILVDGQDISHVSQASLRDRIGVVTQDTALLHRSIRDNIALGQRDATDAQIRSAAARAHAMDFVADLADIKNRTGLDAHVGERGVKLSGGQRQRIAIARVLLKDAPILVLDEATSALDSEIEAAIQESLMDLMRGKTVIAIAHRLSTIAAMDRLVVMDRGRIVEDGGHEELLQRGGLYAELWRRQSGGFLAAGDKLSA